MHSCFPADAIFLITEGTRYAWNASTKGLVRLRKWKALAGMSGDDQQLAGEAGLIMCNSCTRGLGSRFCPGWLLVLIHASHSAIWSIGWNFSLDQECHLYWLSPPPPLDGYTNYRERESILMGFVCVPSLHKSRELKKNLCWRIGKNGWSILSSRLSIYLWIFRFRLIITWWITLSLIADSQSTNLGPWFPLH